MKRWINAMEIYHDIKGEFFEDLISKKLIKKLCKLNKIENLKKVENIIFVLEHQEFLMESDFKNIFKFYVENFWKINKSEKQFLNNFVENENYSIMLEKYKNLFKVLDCFLIDIRNDFSNNLYYQKNYKNFEQEYFRKYKKLL